MTHWQFVALSYAVSAAVMCGLVGSLLFQSRRLARRLRQLEARQAARQQR